MIAKRLVPYSETYILPKDFIRTALSGSLLDQALQEEPDLPELDINTPDVTPRAMRMLVDYSQRREPNQHVPELILLNAAYTGRKCLLESGRYSPKEMAEYDTIIAELRSDPRMRKLLSEREYVFDPNVYICD